MDEKTKRDLNRTEYLLGEIKTVLVYTAPEQLATKLCRLMIDECGSLVKESDKWIARWLRESLGEEEVAAKIERQEHWKWIQAKKFEMQ